MIFKTHQSINVNITNWHCKTIEVWLVGRKLVEASFIIQTIILVSRRNPISRITIWWFRVDFLSKNHGEGVIKERQREKETRYDAMY